MAIFPNSIGLENFYNQILPKDSLEKARFYEENDLIARIEALDHLTHKDPYGPSKEIIPYWERIKRALTGIPLKFHQAAIALFASVIYLDKNLLDEIMRSLVSEAGTWCQENGISASETFLFAVDHPELTERFYDYGNEYGWQGRLDDKIQLNFNTCSHVLMHLEALIANADKFGMDISPIFKKKVWIVVTDNALSGYSAYSDLERLKSLANLFQVGQPPQILFCSQIISQEGVDMLKALLGHTPILYGLLLGDECRVNSLSCKLFTRIETLESVQQFCRWFGNEHFGNSSEIQSSFASTIDLHRTIPAYNQFHYDHAYAYGWRDCGFTVVTRRNTPTNSVPALFYPCIGQREAGQLPLGILDPAPYSPPFPRDHSRLKQKTSGDTERLEKIKNNLSVLKQKLFK